MGVIGLISSFNCAIIFEMKRETKAHYVDNKEFSRAVVEYVNSVNAAKDIDGTIPIVTEYIGTCFLKIAEKASPINPTSPATPTVMKWSVMP